MEIGRRFPSLTLLLALSAFVLLGQSAWAVTCESGAQVSNKEQCKFFYFYNNTNRALDPRIALRVGAQKPDDTRSIALVIGIDTYPNLPNASIKAAAKDVDNLKIFLKEKQKFDEIIVIQNDSATGANIDYFLYSYLPQRASIYNHRARVLIAYSGHGIPQNGPTSASFVLSRATNLHDESNLYSLTRVRAAIEDLSKSTFHVLALLNSCYGGNVFGLGFSGENPSVSSEPGSYALTAGPSDTAVATLGGPNDGSVFFDTIIKGVGSGDADTPLKIVVGDGSVAQSGDIVRLGALNNYLTEVVEHLPSVKVAETNETFKIPPPWLGAVEPPTGIARGGFFFLAPVVVRSTTRLALDVPPGPRSSLKGRPDVKIFGPTDSYPIHGIDVASWNGQVDWAAVKSSGITFAYIRAIDPRFEENWKSAADNAIDRAPYFIFSFCRSPEFQAEQIKKVLRDHKPDLPPALDLEFFGLHGPEGKCQASLSNLEVRDHVFQVASALQSMSGRVPLIYASNQVFGEFSEDKRFKKFMVWLGNWSKSGKADSTQIELRGSNPWTLWQYHSFLKDFIMNHNRAASQFDQNVFFGTKEQYIEFKTGKTNSALQAVVQ